MNHLKRALSIPVVCALALGILTACNGDNTPSATTEWKADKENHWTLSADGERENVTSHTFDANGMCPVCRTLMSMDKDGSLNLQTFNEDGDIQSWVAYNPAGEKDTDRHYEYKYDEAGNKSEAKVHNNGKLEMEAKYDRTDKGEEYIAEQTSYNNDGSKHYTESNKQQDTVKEVYYDTEGEVELERHYEYKYDDDGKTLGLKIYENDLLIEDDTYAYASDGETYVSKRIEYWADGSITTTVYDETGETLSETYYDALLDETTEM